MMERSVWGRVLGREEKCAAERCIVERNVEGK
jgi:hypothetical protein